MRFEERLESALFEVKCPNPKCGSMNAYVGFTSVKCDNPACMHYSGPKVGGSIRYLSKVGVEVLIDLDKSEAFVVHGFGGHYIRPKNPDDIRKLPRRPIGNISSITKAAIADIDSSGLLQSKAANNEIDSLIKSTDPNINVQPGTWTLIGRA